MTKREMLKHIVQTKGCYQIKCEECPYNVLCTSMEQLRWVLDKLNSKALKGLK